MRSITHPFSIFPSFFSAIFLHYFLINVILLPVQSTSLSGSVLSSKDTIISVELRSNLENELVSHQEKSFFSEKETAIVKRHVHTVANTLLEDALSKIEQQLS